MRKILISPGYGAGWTTWNSDKVKKYMLEYQPIIEFLEAGNRFTHEDCHSYNTPEKIHPLLKQLQKECEEKFGETYVCILGASDLEVVTVSGLVRVNEYDGSESYESQGEFNDWI